MTRRLLLGATAAGLMLALAAPPSAEAGHRHSRSRGHRGSYVYVSPGYRYGYGPWVTPGYYGYSYRPGYYSSRYDPYYYSSRYYGPRYYSPYYRRNAPYPGYYYRGRWRPRISIHLDF